MCLPPGSLMDSGQNDQQRRTIITAAYTVFGLGNVLALISLGLRMYVKTRITKKTGFDDVFITLTWALSLTTQVSFLVLIRCDAIIIHNADLSPANLALFVKMAYAITPVYLFCHFFAKLNQLTCYMPLSPQRTYKRVVWCIVGAIGLHTAILLFMFILTCRPVERSWDIATNTAEAVCLHRRALYLAFAVGNVLGDLLCMAVPVEVVLARQMRWTKKAAALAVLFAVSITFITSAVRGVYTWKLFDSTDWMWDVWPLVICILLEANLLVICGCLTNMPKFCRHLLEQVAIHAHAPHDKRSVRVRDLTTSSRKSVIKPRALSEQRSQSPLAPHDAVHAASPSLGFSPSPTSVVDEGRTPRQELSKAPSLASHTSLRMLPSGAMQDDLVLTPVGTASNKPSWLTGISEHSYVDGVTANRHGNNSVSISHSQRDSCSFGHNRGYQGNSV